MEGRGDERGACRNWTGAQFPRNLISSLHLRYQVTERAVHTGSFLPLFGKPDNMDEKKKHLFVIVYIRYPILTLKLRCLNN